MYSVTFATHFFYIDAVYGTSMCSRQSEALTRPTINSDAVRRQESNILKPRFSVDAAMATIRRSASRVRNSTQADKLIRSSQTGLLFIYLFIYLCQFTTA